MNYWDSGEWNSNSLVNTFSSLPSTVIIGWQVPDEVLLFTKVIVNTAVQGLQKTTFIQIYP